MQPDATFLQVFKRSRSYRSVLSPPPPPISEAAAGLPEDGAEWDTIESESVATLPISEA